MKVSPTVAGFSAAAACTRWRSDSAQATASADRLRAAPSSSTQGANPLRMAQSQVGGDLATVAAANHGRRDDPRASRRAAASSACSPTLVLS
jgi:hypothetical protein